MTRNLLSNEIFPLACAQNGVTHVDTKKKQNLEFDWEAPVGYEGTIIFK